MIPVAGRGDFVDDPRPGLPCDLMTTPAPVGAPENANATADPQAEYKCVSGSTCFISLGAPCKTGSSRARVITLCCISLGCAV